MFKNSIFYSFEKLSPKLISVLLLPILLRLIKPELWAEITLLLALQLLISYFLTQGDERSILKFTSEEEVLYRSFTSLLRISLLVLMIFEMFALYIWLGPCCPTICSIPPRVEFSILRGVLIRALSTWRLFHY